MSTGRYRVLFEELARRGEGAFVPFITLGDPTPEMSLEIVRELLSSGADALELGIPFSDPIADGPTIQASVRRALSQGTTPRVCFDLLARIRAEQPSTPMGLLVYANLVVANGLDSFYRSVAAAGVDSVLVADVPVAESGPFADAACRHGIDPVLIVPPNATGERLRKIAATTHGYTYVVARAGITGADDEVALAARDLLDRLRELRAPPGLVGFGISRPEHVRTVLDAGAAGAISGSAIVELVGLLARAEVRLESIGAFVRTMKRQCIERPRNRSNPLRHG